MRVLIADRNARLLESISRTFAPQFSIHTASSRRQCSELLQQGEFDLAIISERLADGPGLQLLGQIARSSPDTLRIFTARRSRLQLLKGKLGPFGLFRTLAYPIEARKLLSALTLARAGLEIEVPAQVAFTPSPAVMRPSVKRVPPAFARPALSANVPMTIASMRRKRPSEPLRAPPQPASQPARSPRPTAVHQMQIPQLVRTAPKRTNVPQRTMVPLGAALALVFLVTSLTLRLFDASAAQSSSAAPSISVPPRISTPPAPASWPHPAPSVAQRAAPKADSTPSEVVAPDPQTVASSAPVADPSTFGSEAYEPIYSN